MKNTNGKHAMEFLTDVETLRLLNEGLATRSHSEYAEGDSPVDMVREDLAAEEHHADDLAKILATLDPTKTT